MSHTFTQLTVHAVFSTKGRRPLIAGALRQRLHGYVASLINNRFGFAREVGGSADHVHVLFDIKATVSVADCMRVVKSVSCGWIHETFRGLAGFAWQEGYGAFCVSCSAIPEVKNYIRQQEKHHQRRSSEEEFGLFLAKHGIADAPRSQG